MARRTAAGTVFAHPTERAAMVENATYSPEPPQVGVASPSRAQVHRRAAGGEPSATAALASLVATADP